LLIDKTLGGNSKRISKWRVLQEILREFQSEGFYRKF
jgi:hypothetical protein